MSDWLSVVLAVVVLVAIVYMVGSTWREVRRQRWIRREAKKTRDPGRLRYLLWLVDRPEFKPRKRGDG